MADCRCSLLSDIADEVDFGQTRDLFANLAQQQDIGSRVGK